MRPITRPSGSSPVRSDYEGKNCSSRQARLHQLVHQYTKYRSSSAEFAQYKNGLFIGTYERWRTPVNPLYLPYKEGVAGSNPASPTH